MRARRPSRFAASSSSLLDRAPLAALRLQLEPLAPPPPPPPPRPRLGARSARSSSGRHGSPRLAVERRRRRRRPPRRAAPRPRRRPAGAPARRCPAPAARRRRATSAVDALGLERRGDPRRRQRVEAHRLAARDHGLEHPAEGVGEQDQVHEVTPAPRASSAAGWPPRRSSCPRARARTRGGSPRTACGWRPPPPASSTSSTRITCAPLGRTQVRSGCVPCCTRRRTASGSGCPRRAARRRTPARRCACRCPAGPWNR